MNKIRVLLLGSPEVQRDFDFSSKIPNLGIASIAGNINDICEVKIADLVVLKPKEVEPFLIKTLKSFQPDVVGFSCMSFQYPRAINLARIVKEQNQAKTVFGGYHATLMHEEITKSRDSDAIDFIVRGEGEKTFRELIQAMRKNSGYKDIKGLSYKENGEFKHNANRELLDLNEIKLPDRSCRLLTKGFHAFGASIDAVETSRGCVQGCKFCSIDRMYGKSFRKYTLERVIEDIRQVKKHGFKSAVFSDDNITLDINRFKKLCELIIEAGLDDLHYNTQASARGIALDEKLAEKMAEAGFKFVFLGIENVLKRNLEFFNKGNLSDEASKAVKLLRDRGIIVAGGFIIGNPEDDEQDLWINFEMARQMKIDFPIFFIATPYPKTKLREELLELGLVVNLDDFSTYDGIYANVRTKYLTREEIQYNMWKMAASYYDYEWMRWNLMRRHYPVYFYKELLKLTPKYLYRKLLRKLGLKTEMQFFEEDAKRREFYKGVH
ncbi:MAG: radical SAM protein [Methanocellales archaeon]